MEKVQLIKAIIKKIREESLKCKIGCGDDYMLGYFSGLSKASDVVYNEASEADIFLDNIYRINKITRL